MKLRQWFRFENAADDPGTVDIHIIDWIGDWLDDYFGFGVTAKAFVDELGKLPTVVKAIRLHINSPGGDVYGAVNIANALRDQRLHHQRTVEVLVEGLAASAATLPMMAGERIRIADNAQVFIHNPWTVVGGTAEDLRRMADDLGKVRSAIIATYRWQSSLSEDELGALMDAQTMMTADEAIANGLATEKIEGLKAVALLDARILAKLPVPEKYRDRLTALVKPALAEPAPADPKAIIAACKQAGVPELAEDLLGQSMAAVTARLDEATAARTKAEARATEIRALCATVKLPDLADTYIRGGMPVAEVRAQLTIITAKLDQVEIDGQLPTDAEGARSRVRLNVVDIYRTLNKLPAPK